MFRSVLSLLLALPLLLPQGMCVCDLMQKCEACADGTAAVEPEKPACGCHKHKPAEPVKTDASTLTKLHTCHQNAPADQPGEHFPCCPVKAGSVQWKAEPIPSPAQPSFGFVGMVSLSLPPAVNSALLTPSFHLSSSDQPLYLTFLTLRI